MNKTSRFPMLVAAACALLVLTACGNKGPLVMPQRPVPIEEQDVVPQPEPAADQQAQEAVDAPPAGDDGDE